MILGSLGRIDDSQGRRQFLSGMLIRASSGSGRIEQCRDGRGPLLGRAHETFEVIARLLPGLAGGWWCCCCCCRLALFFPAAAALLGAIERILLEAARVQESETGLLRGLLLGGALLPGFLLLHCPLLPGFGLLGPPVTGAGVDALSGAIPLGVGDWFGRVCRLLKLFSPVAEFFPSDVVELAAAGSMPFGPACDGVGGSAAAEVMAVVQAATGCP